MGNATFDCSEPVRHLQTDTPTERDDYVLDVLSQLLASWTYSTLLGMWIESVFVCLTASQMLTLAEY